MGLDDVLFIEYVITHGPWGSPWLLGPLGTVFVAEKLYIVS